MPESGYFDERRRYCRRLGHPVPFKYCRLTGEQKPCVGILSCWETDREVRPVAEDIAGTIPHSPTPDKAVHLYDLIRRARENAAPY